MPNVVVTTSGPVFSARNTAIVQKHTHNMVQELVEKGEQRLDDKLRPRPAGVFLSLAEAGPKKVSKGHYRRSVNGRVSGLYGEINDNEVIYGPWLEGLDPRNRTTRFKGYAQFRKTAQDLEKKHLPVVVKKHTFNLVRELNGGI